MKKFLTILLMGLVISSSIFANGQSETEQKESKTTIGFAVSTLSNEFFVMMKEAGEKKANELGVDIITLDAQDSSEKQADQVSDLINKKVDLIILNPVDSDACVTSVYAANDANIPVITVTRMANDGDVVQHLDIDNKEAGALVAEQVIKDFPNGCKVAVLEGIPGASSTNDRSAGFVNGIKGTNIEIVSSLSANYNREEGATVMEDVLQGHPDIDVVYAHNDEMALGAVRAIDAAGLTGKIKVYGVDAVDDAINAIKVDEMRATVQQQPKLQMEMAMQSAIDYLNGKSVESRINIPLKLLTKDNL
ncbi:MAG: substrate-binding domain-containing protein [Pleomorphochaeta sp.]